MDRRKEGGREEGKEEDREGGREGEKQVVMYASQFSQTSTPSLKANFCIFLFSSILTIMPEMIISQKAVSFCPSGEIVAIFLKKDYPGLSKSRTLKHKIFLSLWRKSIHCRKT